MGLCSMKADQIEAIHLQRLHAEVLADLESLAQIISQISEALARLEGGPDPDRTMALAAYLHHWYTGTEAIHQRIAQTLEGGTASGRQWHRQLLEDMSLNIPEVRPQVISRETARHLGDYLGFRHVFRHAYGTELDMSRLKQLAERLPQLWEQYGAEVRAFLGYLSTCARECNSL